MRTKKRATVNVVKELRAMFGTSFKRMVTFTRPPDIFSVHLLRAFAFALACEYRLRTVPAVPAVPAANMLLTLDLAGYEGVLRNSD